MTSRLLTTSSPKILKMIEVAGRLMSNFAGIKHTFFRVFRIYKSHSHIKGKFMRSGQKGSKTGK